MAVIQHLKQNVKHIRMCFLDFIKKNDTIWISAYFFAELSALIISHIAWRRTDQLGNTVFLHIFRHIHTNHSLFTAKHSLSQRLGKFCFPNACRSKKQERTDWTVRILQSHTATFYSLRNSMHCFLLTNHTFVKFLFQLSKTSGLSFRQSLYRNFGPVGYNGSYSFFVHFSGFSLILLFFFYLKLLKSGFCFLLFLLAFFGKT